MKQIKKPYISIYYIILALSLVLFQPSCKSVQDSELNTENSSISYDIERTFDIKYEDTSIDLDNVSNEIKQKFYHNENLYQNNLNSLFKDIVIEKYIKDLSSTDHISIEEAVSKAYSSLGFSFLGLTDLEKKEELFKKIVEQKNIKLKLQTPSYPTVALNTKDFPRIKELTTTTTTPLQIVIFSSLSCLKCSLAYSWLKEISQDPKYKDRLEIIYKPLTLSDLDFLIQFEIGSICAYKQNHFNEYTDYIYNHISELSDISPSTVVSSIQGIEQSIFDECLSQKSDLLDISIKESEQLGIYTTPSFFINSRLYPQISSLNDLKDILDEIEDQN